MHKSIDCKCGIYDTEYRLIKHRDGNISVKSPDIQWDSHNTGRLVHRTIHVAEDDQADVLAFFESNELLLEANNNGGCLTLDDVLYGNRVQGVHVIV